MLILLIFSYNFTYIKIFVEYVRIMYTSLKNINAQSRIEMLYKVGDLVTTIGKPYSIVTSPQPDNLF